MKVIVAFLVLCVFSCGSKKPAIEKSSPEKVVQDSLIISKVPDTFEPPALPLPSVSEKKAEILQEKPTIPLPPEPPKPTEVENKFDHTGWDIILKKYVSENGKVDYSKLKDELDLDSYVDMLIHKIPDDTWSKSEKLAYWINAYNALTIDLILRNYPVNSIKDIKDPWDQRLWQFGDKWLNLNDIEHKILRKMNEPRIHFAIVCASVSCPKLQNEAFTASNLEDQLTNATVEFLADTSKNELSENRIKLSKIFKWFKKDFEQNGRLVDFLNQYANVSISANAKKSYKDYNWDLND